MAKISVTDIKADTEKLTGISSTLNSAGFFSPQGIKQFKDIIDGIKDMLKEAKELQYPIQPNTVSSINTAIQAQSEGLTKEQLIGFARQFIDTMIAQGYGNKTLSQAVNAIPFTIEQIRGFLK